MDKFGGGGVRLLLHVHKDMYIEGLHVFGVTHDPVDLDPRGTLSKGYTPFIGAAQCLILRVLCRSLCFREAYATQNIQTSIYIQMVY